MIDNFLVQRYVSVFNLPQGAGFRFIEGDVTTVDLAPHVAGCDAVIQLAAITDAAGSFSKKELVEANNLIATARVADACVAAGVPLLYPSSTSVYGTQAQEVDEDCTDEDLKPQSPYAEIKIKEETLVRDLVVRKGLRAAICRFGTIYGVSPGMRFHTAVNKFCWQAATGQKLTVWRTAYDQMRPYLAVEDAARAVMFFIEKNLWDGRTYNVVTSNHTVRDVIYAIRPHIRRLEVTFVDTPIMNQLSYAVRNKHLDALGFTFEGNLARGIAETLALLGDLTGAPR
jgi:nucleoside-diphosphate-sugar epimerase